MSIDTTEPIGQVFYAADGGDDETGAGYYMKPCVHWFGKAPAADTKLYTTPQPAQATQVEVTDEQIKEAAVRAAKDGKLSWLGFDKDDQDRYTIPVLSKSHYQFARAILALRPERVPMTDGIRPEDFTVDVVVKPMGGFAPVNTQGVRVTHKPTGISVTCDAARSQHTNRHQAFEKLSAILAQRPERVPMTDEQISLEAHNADEGDWNDLRFRSSWHEGFLEGARFAEAHHGITSQAKKETP